MIIEINIARNIALNVVSIARLNRNSLPVAIAKLLARTGDITGANSIAPITTDELLEISPSVAIITERIKSI